MMQLTPAALHHLKNMVTEKKALGFRLSLKSSGCSGYAYHPEIIQQAVQDDFHFVQDDLSIYIDPRAQDFLTHTIIDYVEENVNGLKQKRLVFVNPQEKSRCGCGESFKTE